MALTSNVIANASDHLDELTKALLINYFRQNPVYRSNALLFSLDLVTKIDAAEGTIKARMLNATIAELDKLGIGEVEIRGDEDAVWWSQQREREALVTSAFLTLYDDIVDGAGSTTSDGVIPDRGLYGNFAVGQRALLVDRFGNAEKLCSSCRSTKPCNCIYSYRVKSYPF